MTAIRDARIRLPDEMIRALDLRCGDVSRSTYVRRLVEQDERTDGAVYAAAVEGLRPKARSGGGVPVVPSEPGPGAAVPPPPAAVAEPVPAAEPAEPKPSARLTRPTTIARGDLLIYTGPPLAELPPGWMEEDGFVYRPATAEDESDLNLVESVSGDVEPEPVSPPRRTRPRTSEEWGS